MTNMIRADVFRFLRSKGLYITFGILIGVMIFIVATINFVNKGSVVEMGIGVLTGAKAATYVLGMGDTMVYFIISLFIGAAAEIFSSGAVKNEISNGVSRTKLYLSKWLFSGFMCVLVTVFFYGTAFVTGAVLNGFGEWTEMPFGTFAAAVGAQLFMLIAFNSVGVFLSFVTKSEGASIGFYFAFVIAPAFVFMFIVLAFPDLKFINDYLPVTVMRGFARIGEMTTGEIIRGFALGWGILVASTIGGVALFERAEIK